MKTKNILIILFLIVAIIQIAVPAKMIYKYENILKSGKEYRFKISPVDPNDPFRGKFISLHIDQNSFKINRADKWENGEDIYVTIDSLSQDKFIRITNISKVKPDSKADFVKAKVDYVNSWDSANSWNNTNGSIVYIKYPFETYYLDENKAPQAEHFFRESIRDSNKLNYVAVKVIDGDAVLKDLIINGKLFP